MATNDFVGIAFGQANRPKVEIAEMQGRNDRIYNQVLGGTALGSQMQNANRSFAQRAAESEQQAQQFDIVQDLRERQFVVDQQQSMAQIAAFKTQQSLAAMKANEEQRALYTLPQRQAAQAALTGLASSAKSVDQLNAASERFFNSPASQWINPVEARQFFDSQRQNIINGENYKEVERIGTDRAFAMKEYEGLTGEPPPPGMLLPAIRKFNADQKRILDLQTQQAQADIITGSKIKQFTAENSLQSAKLPEADKLRFDSLVDFATKNADSFDPAVKKQAQDAWSEAQSMVGRSPAWAPSTGAKTPQDWLAQNPDDPNAPAVASKLGMKLQGGAWVPVTTSTVETVSPGRVAVEQVTTTAEPSKVDLLRSKYGITEPSQKAPSGGRGPQSSVQRQAQRIEEQKKALDPQLESLSVKLKGPNYRGKESDRAEFERLLNERAALE